MAFPTTFLTIRNNIFAKLRWDDSAANIVLLKDFINHRYAEICMRTEALQTKGTMTLTPNEPSYLLDVDIIRIKMIRGKAAGSTDWGGPLYETDLDDLLELRRSVPYATNDGAPSRYSLIGKNRLELHPAPATADTLEVWYVYLPTALSADGDIPELQEPYVKLIEYGASYDVALIQKDPDALLYREDYERGIREFRGHMNRRAGGPVQQLRVAYHVPRLSVHPSADLGV